MTSTDEIRTIPEAAEALAAAAREAADSMHALNAAWEASRAKPPTLADARREVEAWRKRQREREGQ